MKSKIKYIKILNNICNHYGIGEEEFMELLKSRENRYILLLILKHNHCLEIESVKKIFSLKTARSINSNLKLAEEKLLINEHFREKYFELEKSIEKKIWIIKKKTRY